MVVLSKKFFKVLQYILDYPNILESNFPQGVRISKVRIIENDVKTREDPNLVPINSSRQLPHMPSIVRYRLKAVLHMSEKQVQGSIIATANMLFGRSDYGEWKLYNRDVPSDDNTLPTPSNLNRTEPYLEAMVLAGIVTEIMSIDTEKAVITYSNDGSGQNGVGNYMVQSFSINGKQRALPTLPVFTEAKATLAEMEILTLEILSAASAGKYTEKEILEKIDFVMTDSTAHNLGVIEEVCRELNTETVPDSLVCNVHPTMMFQRKIKDVFQEIHDSIGTNAIKECFLVDLRQSIV